MALQPLSAQIRVDNTTRTLINADCSTECRISGDSVSRNSLNLFHSFERFSIREDARVIFSNPGVENILVRVTGNRRSQLRGALQVRGSANFFLINPNGIIFRDGAQLDINGTFVATTADSIAFGDRGEFSAINPETDTSLLTVQPSALRFPVGDHQNIRNQAFLNLGESASASLIFVGGSIQFEDAGEVSGSGNLVIKDGLLQLAAVSGEGDVEFNPSTQTVVVPDSMQQGEVQLSDVILNVGTGQLIIDAGQIRGDTAILSARGDSEDVGTIRLRASDRIVLMNGSISTSSSSLSSSRGEIVLEAGNDIQLRNSSILGRATQAGNGSQIEIRSEALILSNRSSITSQTDATGNAGEIFLDIREAIKLRNSLINSFSSSGALGNAGTINIDTESLQLDASAQISTSVFGNGGRGGNIFIQTNTLNLGDNSEIAASVTSSQPGGNITIDAGRIELDQTSRIEAETSSEGIGGNVTLRDVDFLLLRRGSFISARALTDGNGGNLNIDSDLIVAIPDQDNDLLANALDGAGGNIDIITNGIFGLEVRPSDAENITNDIDASSRFGVDGVVSINRLEVDPSQSLDDLPNDVVNVAGLIDESVCQATGSSEFVNVARGGVAPTQTEVLSTDAVWEDWRLTSVPEDPSSLPDNVASENEGEFSSLRFIEAQEWKVNDDGDIELVAPATDASSQRGWNQSLGCVS
ncbi:MAG: filamentous hemagglutinin N-terminal domain-containing protein [Cyanobacteria bacterium P01_E01_bin.6]